MPAAACALLTPGVPQSAREPAWTRAGASADRLARDAPRYATAPISTDVMEIELNTALLKKSSRSPFSCSARA